MVAKRNDIIDPKKPVRVDVQIEEPKEEVKPVKNIPTKKENKEIPELKEDKGIEE